MPEEKMDLDANEAMLRSKAYMLSAESESGSLDGYVKFAKGCEFDDKLDFLMRIQENITNLIVSITAMHAQDGSVPDTKRTVPQCNGDCENCLSCPEDDDDEKEPWKNG